MKPKLVASDMRRIQDKAEEIRKELEEFTFDIGDDIAHDLHPAVEDDDPDWDDVLDTSELVAGVVLQMILTQIVRDF